MDRNGRPDHINDALCQLYRNSWYKYTDNKNQTYANLRLSDKIGVGGVMVDNPVTELPTETVVNNKLKALQDEFDAVNTDVAKARRSVYLPIWEQLDLLYKDMAADKGDKSGEWFKAIKKVKDDNPKD
tara:strand:+ start:473 stop:856 length:384 start_codon:yes stop_codon:yes gene_type:complete